MSNAIRLGAVYLLAAFFVFMGLQKFGAYNPVFGLIAERSGLSFFEPGVRVLVGVGEIAAAALLTFAATRGIGALLGLALVGGAVVFHLSPWLGVNVPVPVEAPIGPGLFIAAVVFTGINLAVVYFERARVLGLLYRFGLRPPVAA